MKLIVGVLANDEYGYDKMVSAARDTCYNSSAVPDDVEVFYIYGHRKGITIPRNSYRVDDDCFYDDSPEIGYGNLLRKTISFFEYCYTNKDFDYILRPNCGSYVNLSLLKKFIIQNNMPQEKVYFGKGGFCERTQTPFVSGAAMLISRDVVEIIVKNKDFLDHRLVDDVALGRLLTQKQVKIASNALRKIVTLPDIINDNSAVDDECYHYFFNRTREPLCFYEIHKRSKEKGLI
jgi:hypothetical protein